MTPDVYTIASGKGSEKTGSVFNRGTSFDVRKIIIHDDDAGILDAGLLTGTRTLEWIPDDNNAKRSVDYSAKSMFKGG